MMNLTERIDGLEGEMVKFLQDLIRIPSVKSADVDEGAPFGRELAQALETVLAWGDAQGFRTKNLGGYAGHIEYGDGDETVGILVHLDVVPAGDGWSFPPFGGSIQEGKIYGRGAIDDKGPAVAAMYALKAMKEVGLSLKRKIRIIFGCDEESNWECMKAYFNVEPKPTLGFTPDGEFPLIFCEKGNLVITFETEGGNPASVGAIKIESLHSGTRRNIVPDKAEAILKFDPAERERVIKFFKQTQETDPAFRYEVTNERIRISVTGKAAHGSTPELGDNALTRLVVTLAKLNGQGKAWEMVRFLAEKIGRDTSGLNLGIQAHDEVSGALTLNLGVLHIDGEKGQAQIDIRYPISADGEQMAKAIGAAAQSMGIRVTHQHIIPSHYVDPKSPLIQSLLAVYRAETGDNTPPLAIGGRTYATTMGNAVAFGPLFPGQPEVAHQRDEHIAVADLRRCCRIYAHAMRALAGEA